MCILLRSFLLRKNVISDDIRIAPMKHIRSVTIIIDRSDAQAEECYALAKDYLASEGLRGEVFIIDMTGRKPIDKEHTISRSSLTLLGRPNSRMRRELHKVAPDLLICLSTRSTYLVKYLVLTSAARFRIGRVCRLPQSMFNIVFDAPQSAGGVCADIFRQVSEMLKKVK